PRTHAERSSTPGCLPLHPSSVSMGLGLADEALRSAPKMRPNSPRGTATSAIWKTRVERTGVGRSIPVGRLTVTRLRDAVRAVLSERPYREPAALLRQSIRARATDSTA